MLRTNVLRAVVILLVLPSTGIAVDGWAQLKAGMTRTEAVAVLGGELLASRGRGFEVAIYDGRAEVVFLLGQVVAWTAPASSQAAESPTNAWQFDQSSRARNSAPVTRRPVDSRKGNGAILPAYRL
jgi:hypothetical protein